MTPRKKSTAKVKRSEAETVAMAFGYMNADGPWKDGPPHPLDIWNEYEVDGRNDLRKMARAFLRALRVKP
jgi:hypothetical protein